MSKYSFSSAQRYAVFTVNNEKCYMCTTPIDLQSMEVDHIIPESLNENLGERNRILKSFGLSPDFDLNSYENWLPSCSGCNRMKGDTVFEPSPIIQIQLQKAARNSLAAIELAEKTISRRSLSRALNTLLRAQEGGMLEAELIEQLKPLFEFHRGERTEEMQNEPFKVTPLFEVLSIQDGITQIKGPYGIGGRPSNIQNSSFDCPNCGPLGAWNGARCVICGFMDDD